MLYISLEEAKRMQGIMHLWFPTIKLEIHNSIFFKDKYFIWAPKHGFAMAKLADLEYYLTQIEEAEPEVITLVLSLLKGEE